MGWKHIPDNEEAWQYYQAGLLYHGFANKSDMIQYGYPADAWDKADWLETRFDGTSARPNYIYLEE